jgi:heme-degrading monooxygenase HmoA
MYVDRIDLSSGLAGTRGLQESTIELGRSRTGAGGFLGQTVLRSYAYPTKFTVLGRWESIEAAWAFGEGDALATLFGDSAIDLTRFDGYDVPIELGEIPSDVAGASFEQFADWTLSTIGKVQAYEESRHELFALQKKHNPGFVAARLYKSAGAPTKYLMHTIFTDKEAARGGGTSPELREFIGAHPAPNYANISPAIEAYAVIHRG